MYKCIIPMSPLGRQAIGSHYVEEFPSVLRCVYNNHCVCICVRECAVVCMALTVQEYMGVHTTTLCAQDSYPQPFTPSFSLFFLLLRKECVDSFPYV